MFDTVLIANRGAIATRIIRTLRRLGIRSVAVYAAADANSLHVRHADAAYTLGDGAAAQTYLDIDKLLAIAKESGAQAIHPGYGFLSENAAFVRRCEAAGLVFIGPTATQIETFGLKHQARALAQAADVPLLPGSALLRDLPEAIRLAAQVGYPVMLKSTAGGGGIGMQLCHAEDQLKAAFETVKRLGAQNFADDGVFVEKFIANARHIEVQVFGDGAGGVLAIGERDCSSQRRHQKVVEECPAPHLTSRQRQRLYATAEALLAPVCYRNAGTVEFILDADTGNFYFLEVNTRLQVEHGVTEMVYGLDLVEWMLRQAAGEPMALEQQRTALTPHGHAMQVRLYAEDPFRDFQPCAGLLSQVDFPLGEGIRIDHWVEAGIEIPAFFDPLLAKIIVQGDDRAQALSRLQQVLDKIQLYGSETNLGYLRALSRDAALAAGRMTTRYLQDFRFTPARIDVLQGGTQTTLQDYPGRRGYWDVGVPPSGPFDSYAFRLANRLLGNADTAAGLEITLQGPRLRFSVASRVVIAGAPIAAQLDGQPLALWQVVAVAAGQELVFGSVGQTGARAYLCVAGGIQCSQYLGSRATFTLGQFGGHNGRALRAGDTLALDAAASIPTEVVAAVPVAAVPARLIPDWHAFTDESPCQLRVIYGPHGAPDFFTDEDIQHYFATHWEVHYNSSRTGIRLIGPKPQWARKDGGEAGLHPSNIHDNAYAFGTVDFTGDMPVILGPDGPSLGGFVCPATVIQADLWRLGQLRAGDRIRFVPVSLAHAVALEAAQNAAIANLTAPPDSSLPEAASAGALASPILARLDARQFGGETTCEMACEIVYRAAGDHFLLVEYGPQALDIRLRFRVHALMQWLQQHPLPGMQELTPGIRSLQVHYDSQVLAMATLVAHLQQGEAQLARSLDQLSVPSRVVHLPLSWDDPACHQAIDKYMQSVRRNAPWCPSNLAFIQRINGLSDIEAVKQIVFDAAYLVMGLGDVYLGAPVATPLDPRHRLVTTKYNPARTWTAENSVGIGGSYLCVYGMEGPGGYQFVGRTLQMWNRYRQTREFSQPWLLRFFDQIRFYPVSHEELTQIRHDFPQGRYPLRIEETRFSLADYQQLVTRHEAEIAAFTQTRNQAFAGELAHWHASGQFKFEAEEAPLQAATTAWPADSLLVESPVSGSIWQQQVAVGDWVEAGQQLLVLESMKMEIPLLAPCAGRVSHLPGTAGARVNAGQPLVVLTNSLSN